MAQLLLSVKPSAEWAQHSHGTVIAAVPDGHRFSRIELTLPHWRILRVAGADPADFAALLERSPAVLEPDIMILRLRRLRVESAAGHLRGYLLANSRRLRTFDVDAAWVFGAIEDRGHPRAGQLAALAAQARARMEALA